MRRLTTSVFLIAAFVLLGPAVRPAQAEDKLGGHFGVVFPVIRSIGGDAVNIADDFSVGFPVGITVKKSDKFAFDLELVPFIEKGYDDSTNVSLTIHPGVLKTLGSSFTAGLRFAFDVGAPGTSFGFTPLIQKGFPQGAQTLFIEASMPVRFQSFGEDTRMGIGFSVHVGVGF